MRLNGIHMGLIWDFMGFLWVLWVLLGAAGDLVDCIYKNSCDHVGEIQEIVPGSWKVDRDYSELHG